MRSVCVLIAVAGLIWRSVAASVEIGGPPPPMPVKEWIKGGPVNLEPGKIVVVEFWATWCGPCREAIPHISELQRKFRDRGVVFMALTDEAPSMVKLFVKKMDERMEYAVGIDEQDRIYESYMNPFGLSGIPHVFVIDQKGLLAWHGNPFAGLEKVVEDLLSGRFDLQGAIKKDGLRKLHQEYLAAVNAPEHRAIANEKAEQLLAAAAKDPAVLNEFAWSILTDPKVKYRDLELALRTAKLAFDASGARNGSVLDTYARALSENNRNNDAIQIQKAAVKLARDEEQKLEFEANLKKYLRLAREKAR